MHSLSWRPVPDLLLGPHPSPRAAEAAMVLLSRAAILIAECIFLARLLHKTTRHRRRATPPWRAALQLFSAPIGSSNGSAQPRSDSHSRMHLPCAASSQDHPPPATSHTTMAGSAPALFRPDRKQQWFCPAAQRFS